MVRGAWSSVGLGFRWHACRAEREKFTKVGGTTMKPPPLEALQPTNEKLDMPRLLATSTQEARYASTVGNHFVEL
jgi:hypothetical protein